MSLPTSIRSNRTGPAPRAYPAAVTARVALAMRSSPRACLQPFRIILLARAHAARACATLRPATNQRLTVPERNFRQELSTLIHKNI
ncbi:MAG: hypothetical protein DLM68_14705 [Hyphomicrobiales bacterium]|nr:MAG: hypothetical protein DLM68_14705 [Hyphomicrobiales bacterium]